MNFLLKSRVGAPRTSCARSRVASLPLPSRSASLRERGEKIGGTVGYSIRLESKVSSRTRILYCTTGVLLRRLQCDRQLQGVSHVVLDEVHERGIDTDFLMILLRDLLPRCNGSLKVILMSATMDSRLFAEYFFGAPIVAIPWAHAPR